VNITDAFGFDTKGKKVKNFRGAVTEQNNGYE